jgi:PA14 domain
VLEYFEAAGGAMAQFSFAPTNEPPPPSIPFTAQYFDNRDLAGTPVLTRTDERVDYQWGAHAPDPTLPADGFSARWTRTAHCEAGTYRFTATGDDGIRVLVDGVVVVDGWRYQSPTTYTADVTLTAGDHQVVVEYFEHTGDATAQFTEARL